MLIGATGLLRIAAGAAVTIDINATLGAVRLTKAGTLSALFSGGIDSDASLPPAKSGVLSSFSADATLRTMGSRTLRQGRGDTYP